MKKKKMDVKDVYVDLQRFAEYYENLPNKVILGEEKNIYEERLQLHFICQELISHKFRLPFMKRYFYRKPYLKATSFGEEIIKFLECLEWSRIHLEGKIFFDYKNHSPQVDLLLKIADMALSKDGGDIEGIGFIPMLPFRPDEYRTIDGPNTDLAINALNRLAMILRNTLLSNGMREAVKSFRRNATERYKQIMGVATQAWKKNCKNLLIRLDWSFRKKYPSKRIRYKSKKEFDDKLIEVDGCRKYMLRYLRNKFGDDLSFYAWKIECGDIKGVHIHWLIALNGSKHQDGINVGFKIAKDWNELLANGETFTYNVNGSYGAENSGLRVINYNDPDIWNILGRYCDYLTKVDYTLKLRMPKNMRSFGCSKLARTLKTKPGPKRKFNMQKQNFLAARGPQGGSSTKKNASND